MNRAKPVYFALILIFIGATLLVAPHITNSAQAASCNSCGLRSSDQPSYSSSTVRDYDLPSRSCGLCPNVIEYRCDLYSCGWLREYGCPRCAMR